MLTTYTKMHGLDNKMYPFVNKMHKQPVRLLFCSFGKDSMATLLLALQHKEPIDAVVNVREYYDHSRNILLGHPLHETWINDVAAPFIIAQGIPLIRLDSKYDFLGLFHRRVLRGERQGYMRGYPLEHACYIQRDIKMKTIREYLQPIPHVIQYVGIAWDESQRLIRLKRNGKVSLMEKYKVSEFQAREICREAGLLSPLYEHSPRTGCWCCPNQSIKQLQYVKTTMPELYDEWMNLYKDSPYYCYPDIKQRYNNIQLDASVSKLI